MKKIFLVLAAFSAIASCSSDDSTPEPNVIGMWKIGKSITYQTSTQENITNEPKGCSVMNTIDFTESDARVVGYAANDNKCIEDHIVTMKYTYNPKTKQMIFYDDMNIPYTVTELTKTNMIIEGKMNVDMDGVVDIIKTYFTRVK
ncbi:lipocalin family protein [Chryseobacterium jejuense]|uniref:lipocalin family protein n=1 Tax=Chryseobacterium jejuense TaxID=445960 RepID=UPI001AE8F5A6|nr:lipocalin family protein [Chryseobacterium jejuense]MBP2619280.1 ethanolamine utilization protein EutQ (cupin superfamily) [Chryseobacterium jejuense]